MDADDIHATTVSHHPNADVHTYDEGDTIVVPSIDHITTDQMPVDHTFESVHEERSISTPPTPNIDHDMDGMTMEIEPPITNQQKKCTRNQVIPSTPIAKRLRKKKPINYLFLHQGGRTAQLFSQRVQRLKRKIKKQSRMKVNDMFRKTVGIIMANIEAAQKHDQVSVEEGIMRYGELTVLYCNYILF